MKCGWIENRLSIETDGYTRPCCLETNETAKISKIENGILNSFNHKKLLLLRQNLDNGFNSLTNLFCYRCEQLESKNQSSLRTSTPLLSENRELKYIQFKFSNQCQLACAHCGSDRSSTWAKINNINPHVKKSFSLTEKFITELKELLPSIKVLKFSGGEPFLQPEHWKLLELLSDCNTKHCELHYITNGLVKPKIGLWKNWGEVKCSVSVDGYEKSYEWFRRGSNWVELLSNINYLTKYSSISINFSLTPYTFYDFFRAKEHWEKNFSFEYYPIVYPEHCSFFKFPKKLILEHIPYRESASNTDMYIDFYINWAKNSDKYWNTVGQSEKLFQWMHKSF